MSKRVKIDHIDEKILHMLIKNARAELKDIAKECGVSCVAISNRIKRLKKNGVISGAVFFPNLSELGGAIMATIGINTESGKEEQIQKIIQEELYIIEPAVSIGTYDLFALVTVKDLNELQKTVKIIKNHSAVKRITVNIWVPLPYNNFSNIDLQPKEA